MTAVQRRRLLCTLGALAFGGSLAGCLDASPAGADTGDEYGDNRLRDDGVVDYPGMVDGAATVSLDERVIEYEDPEATFGLEAYYRGERDDGSDLRVSRDLSGETMAAFIAPVYDEADERFEFHLFANDAFVGFADWHLVGFTDVGPEDLGTASFERLGEGVHTVVVDPDFDEQFAVVDASAGSVASEGTDELSGINVLGNISTGVPEIAFEFEYDAVDERLVVRHGGGDTVDALELQITGLGEQVRIVEPFEGRVRTGDTAIISVPSHVTVLIRWRDPHGDRREVLATWEGPDA